MTKIKLHLIEINACDAAICWVGERSLDEAWAECERADWMLWLAGKHCGEPGWLTERDLRFEACHAAEFALQFAAPEDVETLRQTISTARTFADGLATDVDLAEAESATYSAAAARSAAYSAAWSAAWSAARSATYSAAEAWSAAYSAAWSAARSATYSAAEAWGAAYSAARSAARSAAAHKHLCNGIRSRWPKVGPL